MASEKQRPGVIIAAILLAMILVISTGQAIPVSVYPEPVLAWLNTQSNGDITDVAVGELVGNGGADVVFIDNFIISPDTAFAVYGINGTEYWTNFSVSGYSIAVGDVDGDTKNEVVAGGWNTNEGKPGITVFEDNGTYKFFYPTHSSDIKDIELGDVDNDGVADIVTCNLNAQGRIYAFNGTDGGNLPGWPQVVSVEPIEDLALGNLDGNPGLDIAAISRYIIPGGTLFVYNSTGALMWSNWAVYGRSVEIGNVDSDPEAEVVIGDWNSSNVYVYNGSTGTLEYSFDTIFPPTEVELGDLDDDPNDVEIAVITGILEDDTLFALDINATGQVNELWNFSIDWTPNYWGEGLAIGDVDGDKKNEVIALSDRDDYGSGNKVWAFDGLDGNGDGVGDVVWMYELSSHPEDVEVGDVDGDGDMDVLVGTAGGNSVYALFTKEPALAVNKTVWDPMNKTWVKELTAKLNDTLQFNCTITNTGNVNLTNVRFWDILDCSLEYEGNGSVKLDGEPKFLDCPAYLFKPKVLHPDNCDWNLSDPFKEYFEDLCLETVLGQIQLWDDTNHDGNVSACDQLAIGVPIGSINADSGDNLIVIVDGWVWYHVERVPYTLNLSTANGTTYFDSILNWNDPEMNLSDPINSEWLEVCCCKDRYTLIGWECKNCLLDGISPGDTVTLRNERTKQEVQFTVDEVAKDLVVSREYELGDMLNPLPPGSPNVARILPSFILEPDQTITIEYNATVVKCGVDTNTFVAKGIEGIVNNFVSNGDVVAVINGGTWYYSDPAVVTITVPCPQPCIAGYKLNENGVGLANWTIIVTNSSGAIVATTTTDGTGYWQVCGLAPGNYTVCEEPQRGWETVDPASGCHKITFGPAYSMNIDFINRKCNGSISDYVWLDADQDGIQDGDESGIAGVTVNLYRHESDGALFDTNVTDGTGFYIFKNLCAGNYSLEFVPPPGFVLSPQNQGDPAEDSDADPATWRTKVFHLDAGEINTTVDAGVYYPIREVPAFTSGGLFALVSLLAAIVVLTIRKRR